MQSVGIGRAEQIEHRIGAIGLDADSVDDERVALITTYGISVPGRLEPRWMRLVHAHPAQLMIAAVQHHGPVLLLYHLHRKLLEDERHRMRPTLVRRIRKR